MAFIVAQSLAINEDNKSTNLRGHATVLNGMSWTPK
jgi:hypothetical protein